MNWRTIAVGTAIAAVVPILSALTEFDPTTILDWKEWAVGIGAASVRQVAIYLTAQLVSNGQ